ncbi:hypothetical protein ALUC_80809S [Aspergillus luchuensis]|nr:hypothetical protein ALUC_80809S [Aspergillus luchuensis]
MSRNAMLPKRGQAKSWAGQDPTLTVRQAIGQERNDQEDGGWTRSHLEQEYHSSTALGFQHETVDEAPPVCSNQ